MYVYMIQRKDNVGYDQYDAMVVAAAHAQEARQLAFEEVLAQHAANAEAFRDVQRSRVWRVGITSTYRTVPGVILASFRAG